MIRVLNNFWLKVVALIMGLLLWFHVATEKIYNYQLTLPVTKIDLREHYTLATPPPESIVVAVSAKGKQLLRSSWRQQGVRISASKFQAGPHNIVLNTENTFLVNPAKNVTLDEVVSPASIDLNVDVESKVDVDVVPDLVTTADEGFAVSRRIEAVPTHVSLFGPKSLLKNINSVRTAKRELSGVRNSVTITVPLVPPPGFGMRLEPDSASLTIDIVPVKTRIYDNLPVVVYNVPVDYTATTIPGTIRIELGGPPEDIDLLNRNALTVSADYKLADRTTGMAPIKIDCPTNFRVRKASADSVRILINSNARSGN